MRDYVHYSGVGDILNCGRFRIILVNSFTKFAEFPVFKVDYSSLLAFRRSDKVGVAILCNEGSKLCCGQIIPTTTIFLSKKEAA